MRCAFISDVHSNFEALAAVVKEIDRLGIKKIFSAGDIIGYGPDPGSCIDLFRRRGIVSVLGNHDAFVAEGMDRLNYNYIAFTALGLNCFMLSADDKAYISGLKRSESIDDLLLVHARPPDDLKNYVWSVHDIFDLVPGMDKRVYIIGHTHSPVMFKVERSAAGYVGMSQSYSRSNLVFESGNTKITRYVSGEVKLEPGCRYVFNPGSVGQPRDGDPRASFGVLADDSFEIRRVKYNIGRTVKVMEDKGYPEFLHSRLFKGR